MIEPTAAPFPINITQPITITTDLTMLAVTVTSAAVTAIMADATLLMAIYTHGLGKATVMANEQQAEALNQTERHHQQSLVPLVAAYIPEARSIYLNNGVTFTVKNIGLGPCVSCTVELLELEGAPITTEARQQSW